jgi:uncharacterized membrane protein YdjX (TVP38/TMEM64 family)
MALSVRHLRIAGVLALAATAGVAVRYFDLPRCGVVVSYFEAMDWHASLCFFVAYIVATLTFLPGAILTIVAGMAFGAWQGFLVVLLSAAVGVSLTFFIARGRVETALNGRRWFRSLKGGLTHGGLSVVLIARLVPIFPYNGLNYALGVLPIRTRDYVVGSMIGMAPGALTYTYIGAVAGCAYLDASLALGADTKAALAVIVVVRVALAGGALWLWRRSRGPLSR